MLSLINPKFVADCVPATFEALLALRPQAYYPHWEAGKVWMKPEFEPLSEEEIRKRIEVEEQKLVAKNNCVAELPQQPLVGMPPTLSSPVADTSLFPVAAQQMSQHCATPRHESPTNGLVPAQVIGRIKVNKPVVKTGGVYAIKTQVQQPKKRLPQEQPIEASTSASPPWQPHFAKFAGMTEEMYDELDPENKLDFIAMFVNDD
jgi:hypothetical protein